MARILSKPVFAVFVVLVALQVVLLSSLVPRGLVREIGILVFDWHSMLVPDSVNEYLWNHLGRWGWKSLNFVTSLPVLALYAILIGKLIPKPAKAGHCTDCGFDLRATQDRCPECGKPVNVKTA